MESRIVKGAPSSGILIYDTKLSFFYYSKPQHEQKTFCFN